MTSLPLTDPHLVAAAAAVLLSMSMVLRTVADLTKVLAVLAFALVVLLL